MTITEYPYTHISTWPYNECEEFYQFLECLQTQVFRG